MALAIEAADVRKTYPPDVHALQGVTLAVQEGTICGVLGPNGAGKSTTVRVLTALTRPDSGAARVAGVDVLVDPGRVRRMIGVVGQRSGADMAATGRENLILQGEFQGMHGRELRRRADESLERFGLADAGDRFVRTYSGGMQRRLDIAMGLLHRPRLLFLDEPTTGLDPESRAAMWREIEALAAGEQMTILLTTHDMEEADTLASRLAIIDRGRVVAEGSPSELKRELNGDTIQIQLADPPGADARTALSRVSSVEAVEADGTTLRARTRDGGAALPAVLAALDDRGIAVTSVTVARPSLDEVYLRHAGRAFTHHDTNPRQEVAA